MLELTLNGIYHRAPNNTFVRIHAPPSPCCFTGLPPSAPMMMLMSPPVPFISEEEGTMDSSSSTSGIPLRYQVILEGPPNPSAEFEVIAMIVLHRSAKILFWSGPQIHYVLCCTFGC